MAEPTDSPFPRFSALARDGGLITVEVGPEPTTYRIHKSVLLHHSDYFRRALRDCWKEGEERKVTIRDIESEAFDIYVDWLYTSKTPEELEAWNSVWAPPFMKGSNILNASAIHLLAVKVYVIADRLDTPKLRHAINNMIVNTLCGGRPPWYQSVIYAFENVPSERRLLDVMVDSHCLFSTSACDEIQGEEQHYANLPHEFLLRVMQRYREMRENVTVSKSLDVCHYQEHTTDEGVTNPK